MRRPSTENSGGSPHIKTPIIDGLRLTFNIAQILRNCNSADSGEFSRSHKKNRGFTAMDMEKLERQLLSRVRRSQIDHLDVMLLIQGQLLKILRYKK